MKPGFQTTEFLSFGVILGGIYDANLLTDPDPFVRGITIASIVVGWVFYAKFRTDTKNAS